MRDSRTLAAVPLLVAFSLAGCASAPVSGAAEGDSAAAENSVVAAEAAKKPEVAPEKPAATVREDSRPDSANSSGRLVTQLNDATRELATLRAANARFQAMRGPDPADEKLAGSLRAYTQFKQELAGIFTDLEKLRTENAALNTKLKDAAAGSQDAKAAVARLEGDLRAEKAARVQAEQSAAKLREQLRSIAAAIAAAGLALDNLPGATEPTARFETSATRLRAASAPATRKYVVKDGDTLERIADLYYRDTTKWRGILEANRGRLPLDGTLPAGLELEIPEK